MAAWTPFLPAGLGVAAAVVALLLDAWSRPRAALFWACALLACGGVAAFVASATWWDAAGPAACLLLTAVALAGGSDSLGAREDGGRIVSLAAMLGATAAFVSGTGDLVLILIGVEVMAVCGFGLVALGSGDRAREAAMKWFVQSAVGTALMIAGTGVLFWSAGGSTLLSSMGAGGGAETGSGIGTAVGAALVVSALALKAGAFPFHSWVPDAYEAAPPVATAVLASAGKIAALIALARVAAAVGTGSLTGWAIAALATGSIVFGNLAALRQRGLARLLAYSAIAQVGYALVAASVGSEGAVRAVTLFAVAYGVAAAAAFLFVQAVLDGRPGWDGGVDGLDSLGATRPGIAVAATILMFSLAGIPLAAGFWGKFLAFAVAAGGGWTWLAVVGAIGSVVSFGYYGSIVSRMWFAASEGPILAHPVSMSPRPATRAVVALAAVVVVLGVAPLAAGLPGLLGGVLGWL